MMSAAQSMAATQTEFGRGGQPGFLEFLVYFIDARLFYFENTAVLGLPANNAENRIRHHEFHGIERRDNTDGFADRFGDGEGLAYRIRVDHHVAGEDQELPDPLSQLDMRTRDNEADAGLGPVERRTFQALKAFPHQVGGLRRLCALRPLNRFGAIECGEVVLKGTVSGDFDICHS